MLKSTNKHIKYWKDRQIDWKQAYFTPEHPHRELIVKELSKLNFGSLLEVGCAVGANLYRVHQHWPGVMLGGLDVNKEAIEVGKVLNPYVHIWQEGTADDLFFSDKSSDIILTDACMIYLSPIRVKKALQEFRRVGRKYLVMCEFNSTKLWERLGVAMAGYYAYDWKKLLTKYGFYGIQIKKIPPEVWGYPWNKYGYIIVAKI